MTGEEMKAYQLRISQAGIADLTLVMLEMEMQWIGEALSAYERQNTEEFITCAEKAQAVQVELMNVMNMENPLSVEVYSVFVYINKILIRAKLKEQPLDLARCSGMLRRYHESFAQIAHTDTGGPVMVQSEKVYAGLTYGSGGLVESSVGGVEFKA